MSEMNGNQSEWVERLDMGTDEILLSRGMMVGINVGGHVIARDIKCWHRIAREHDQLQAENEKLRGALGESIEMLREHMEALHGASGQGADDIANISRLRNALTNGGENE